MKKILHVAANFGGGVVTAMQGYIANSPQHQHYLLVDKHESFHNTMTWASNLVGQYTLPRALIAGVLTIRKVAAEIQPDWIHLHSSFAGGYGRLSLLPRAKMIYTPHCYAFERLDIPPALRAAYWFAEQILAAGNVTLAAISPHEALLAKQICLPQRIVTIPNVAVVPASAFAARQAHQRTERLRVAMVGRLTPQKDPDFFIDVVRQANAKKLPIDFIWLGGGNAEWQAKIQALGAAVSGWISHEEILQQLAGCDVYFHTAAWESGPLSVLEAAQLGLLMVCRSIPAIDMLPVQPSYATPAAIVAALEAIAAGNTPPELAHINAVLNTANSNDAQRTALATLYGA